MTVYDINLTELVHSMSPGTLTITNWPSRVDDVVTLVVYRPSKRDTEEEVAKHIKREVAKWVVEAEILQTRPDRWTEPDDDNVDPIKYFLYEVRGGWGPAMYNTFEVR